jgi:hypothetical protein
MTHDNSDWPEDDADLVERINDAAALFAKRVADRFAAADKNVQAILEKMDAPVSQATEYLQANPIVDPYTLYQLLERKELKVSAMFRAIRKENQVNFGKRRHDKRLAEFEKWMQEQWQAHRAGYKFKGEFAKDMILKWRKWKRRLST